jgi:molybdenum cofactor guanylyltransferase
MNTATPSLSAIVLAGGLSSRMGQDKALIEINQVPLLAHICRIAQQCADPVYVQSSSSPKFNVQTSPMAH